MWIVTRVYYFNIISFNYLFKNWDNWSWIMISMVIFYFVILSMFNILVLTILVVHLFKFMTSKNKEDRIKQGLNLQKCVLPRCSSLWQSSLIQDNFVKVIDFSTMEHSHGTHHDHNTHDPHPQITKLPYRRVISSPETRYD